MPQPTPQDFVARWRRTDLRTHKRRLKDIRATVGVRTPTATVLKRLQMGWAGADELSF